MHIERDNDSTSSDLGICFFLIEKINAYFSQNSKIYKCNLDLKKRKICERSLVEKYVYKIPSRYVDKQLSYNFECTKVQLFTLFTRNSAFFRFSNFARFGQFEKCSRVSSEQGHSDQATCITHPNHFFLPSWSRDLGWSCFGTRS